MGKALVIKGANFLANRVAHVTFNVVHCTGIMLSSSALSFNALGATATLTATTTPADCEEPVLWSSSDTNCCTVNNGLVSVVGVGTCTITATCGNYSATCAITVEVTLTEYGKYNNSLAYPANNSNDITTVSSYKTDHTYLDKVMCGIATDQTETKLLVDLNMTTSTGSSATLLPVGERPRSYREIGWCIPIALPPHCTKIRVHSLDNTFKTIALFFKKNVASSYCGGYVSSRKITSWSGSTTTNWPWAEGQSAEFDIPAGYDSVVVNWQLDTENSPFDAFCNATEEQLAAFTITAC